MFLGLNLDLILYCKGLLLSPQRSWALTKKVHKQKVKPCGVGYGQSWKLYYKIMKITWPLMFALSSLINSNDFPPN